MKQSASRGYINATDVADYLVRKGMEFRNAHEVVGNMVKTCIVWNKTIDELTVNEFKQFSELFEDDVLIAVQLETCIEAKKSYGSTARQNVLTMIENGKLILDRLVRV